jgi:hypothetical protein
MAPLPTFLKPFRKRKKDKQDPPGSSSQPPSQSPTRAPTPNPIPSATDSSSKAGPAVTTPDNVSNQRGNTSSDRSVAQATALNLFKFTLTTLSTASDNIPVPGLKLALDGLLSVIEKVQVRSRIFG